MDDDNLGGDQYGGAEVPDLINHTSSLPSYTRQIEIPKKENKQINKCKNKQIENYGAVSMRKLLDLIYHKSSLQSCFKQIQIFKYTITKYTNTKL